MFRAWRDGGISRSEFVDIRLKLRNPRVQLNNTGLRNDRLQLKRMDERMYESSNRRSHFGIDIYRNQWLRRLMYGHDNLCPVPNRPSVSIPVSKDFHTAP